MLNEILSIFDQSIQGKCWIETYGRLAITGKQKIGDKWRRFPLSTVALDPECENLVEHISKLCPDDTKAGVAFWRALSKIKYAKLPGISSNRRIRKAEVNLQFLSWVNVRKASGVNTSTNWDAVMNGIIKEAVKTIECRNPITPTGVIGISNLMIEVTNIGSTEDWRRAMAEYTIDNLEAISVWPFSGFTLDCRLTFLTRQDCFEAFDCSTEINCTDMITTNYSLTEQVYPYGKWVDGKTIYQKTWDIGNGNNDLHDLTGLTTAMVDNIVDAVVFGTNISDNSWALFTTELSVDAGQYQVFTTNNATKVFVTCWYTKK